MKGLFPSIKIQGQTLNKLEKKLKRTLWLRAETKTSERRTPLTPLDAKRLTDEGIKVYVEKSHERIFSDEEYAAVGCQLEEAGSWQSAPLDTYILGLKELPVETPPLIHHHIYFAHAYKGQNEARQILKRFQQGGGRIYDLEFLLDENGRRVSAFGHWAGFVGAALAIDYYYHKHQSSKPYPALKSFPTKEGLLEQIGKKQASASSHPRLIVIGAHGRCGQGAVKVARNFNLEFTQWDSKETRKGGPFKEILDHEIFINTVLLSKEVPPFINREILRSDQKLEIIGDISCDPNNPNNPVPLYDRTTSWEKPFLKVDKSPKDLHILAVDNLPSVLPKESSEDFSAQLTPHLLNLFQNENDPVWQRSLDFFEDHLQKL